MFSFFASSIIYTFENCCIVILFLWAWGILLASIYCLIKMVSILTSSVGYAFFKCSVEVLGWWTNYAFFDDWHIMSSFRTTTSMKRIVICHPFRTDWNRIAYFWCLIVILAKWAGITSMYCLIEMFSRQTSAIIITFMSIFVIVHVVGANWS